MEKYHHDDIPPIERENERDENYKGANEQIDSSRTKDNYNIIKCGGSYLEYINSRIKELGCKTKKDTVLMASFVIGASPDFFVGLSPKEQRQYFRECVEFFAERYGSENIISAVVHLDETTPHLHLNLMPVLDGRLCCKQLFDRNALRGLQTDLHEQVGKHWGLKRGEEGSNRKHLDTAEYKAKKIVQNAVMKAAEIDEQSSAKRQAEEQTIASLTTQKETLLQEIGDYTEMKSVADEPIPLLGKDRVIKSLRVENAQLRKDNADKDKKIENSQRNQADVYKLYEREKKRNDYNVNASYTLEAMQKANPTLYAELLRQAKEAQAPKTASPNSNRWK